MLHHIFYSCFQSWLPTVFFLVGAATTIALQFYLVVKFFSKDELKIGEGPFITHVYREESHGQSSAATSPVKR